MKQVKDSLGPKKQPGLLFKNLIETQKIKKQWANILGEPLATNLHFEYIKEHCCMIYVDNPCWANEMAFYEKRILEKLNKSLNRKPKLQKIILRVKT